ncbi:MAG TPA: MFS transporter [Bosea sp. (in: a-proteobacteria)]
MNQHVPVGDGDALAKRNSVVLACAQALGGSSPPIVISLGGIVGSQLVTDQTFATVPVSLMQLGIACGVIPAAMLMRRLGRRNGYLIGALIGATAASVAAAGTSMRLFWLFCLGTFACGLYGAFVQSYRFAAADAATDSFRPRAISWVMIGGIAAGVIGPQAVYWTRDLTPDAPFAASFVAQGCLALIAMLVILQLRAPPVAKAASAGGRPLSEIMRQPKFIASVTAGLVTYGLMSFLMTAAPLAMIGCGHTVGDAALGIQWHVLAMFGPSFFTGRLIARFGKAQVTMTGLVLTALAAVVGLSGLSVVHFWTALILLGIGWNFGFIGATALVTDCYRPEERVKVQAANDFLVFGSVAIASFSSGGLLHAGGWDSVNWLVFPPVVIALALVAWQGRGRRAVAA